MAVFTWLTAGAVRVTGSDRIAFVHGQTSNDVRGLSVPGACRALILNARGQIEFDVRIYRREQDLYLQTAAGLGGAVLERLKRYVVFDDVQLEDLSETLRVVHVSGGGALELMGSFGHTDAEASVQQVTTDFAGTVLVARVDRGNGLGFDIHLLSQHAGALQSRFERSGVQVLPSLETARIRAGLADAHTDAFLGLLPQECGLVEAVSYRKGCYIGQEIMARVEARGHTNRSLVRVRAGQALEAGSAVVVDGTVVGSVGHFVAESDGFLALAVLRKDATDGLEVSGVPLTLEALPVPD
jgi:hypothetical protein